MLIEEVSEDLGVSRRRAQTLAQSGELRAERLGSMWVVDPADLAEYKLKRQPGRPVSPAVAWQILSLLSGVESPRNDPMIAFRARQHLRGESIIGKLRRSRRSIRHRWRILPADVGVLVVSGVVTGVAAADGAWFDVVAVESVPSVYLDSNLIDGVIERLHPLTESASQNVEVLIPNDDWVLGVGDRAPGAVVAADLLLDPDPRIRRAAESHLDFLQASWKGPL